MPRFIQTSGATEPDLRSTAITQAYTFAYKSRAYLHASALQNKSRAPHTLTPLNHLWHCIGYLGAKHFGVQGPRLHVMLAAMHTNYDSVQVLLHCIGHLGAKHFGAQGPLHCIGHLRVKHLGMQGPRLHVMLAAMHTNYDSVQVLLHCIGHVGAKHFGVQGLHLHCIGHLRVKHLEGVLSTLSSCYAWYNECTAIMTQCKCYPLQHQGCT